VDLNEALREAAAEPPPTSIDLDALIRQESRRERRQRWLSGTGIAAGVAATVGVAAIGFSGGALPGRFAAGGAPPCPVVSPAPSGASGSPGSASGNPSGGASGSPGSASGNPSGGASGNPSSASGKPSGGASGSPGGGPQATTGPVRPRGPVPTESCGIAARRFNQALTDTLHRVAPGATLTNTRNVRLAPVWFERDPNGAFIADVTMRHGNRVNRVYIEITPYANAPTRQKACGDFLEGCTHEVQSDGTMVVKMATGKQKIRMPDGTFAQSLPGIDLIVDGPFGYVEVYRPDGTLVVASIVQSVRRMTENVPDNVDDDELNIPEPAVINADQLKVLAQTPQLTLFP
jgi:hypothetical protein